MRCFSSPSLESVKSRNSLTALPSRLVQISVPDPLFRSSNQRHQRIICLTARQQIAAIDEMVVGIEKQKADEIKHRDFCIADLAQNEKAYLWLLSASTDQIRLNPYFLADDAELIR